MFAFRRVAGAVLPDGAGMVDGCEAEGADDPVPVMQVAMAQWRMSMDF